MKEKIVLILILALLITPFSVAQGAEITDIDEDHWAYEIILELVDEGFLTLYEDDTFQAEREITRMELVEVINRLLEHIEQRDVALTGADMRELREIAVELRENLVDISEEQENIFERLNELDEHRVIFKEDLARFYEELEAEEKEREEIRESFQALEEEVDALVDEIVAIAELEEKINALEAELEQFDVLAGEIEELERVTLSLEQDVVQFDDALKEAMEELATDREMDVQKLIEEMEENKERIDQLESQNRLFQILLGGLAGTMLIIFFLN